jgi:hypothetical protein
MESEVLCALPVNADIENASGNLRMELITFQCVTNLHQKFS